MKILKLACLGRFQASFADAPLSPFRTSKVQALLIYLAVEAAASGMAKSGGTGHRREALMELLWPEQPLKAAQQNLRQTLYQLRKAIPEQESEAGAAIKFIESSRITIGINPAYSFELDVANFGLHLQEGNLEAAVTLYRGDFLTDFYLPDSSEFESWAQLCRSTYRRQASEALDKLTADHLHNGRCEQGLQFARQQLALDDLNERAHRQVMEALARLGQREAALAQYEGCRQLLAEELGVEPTQATEILLANVQKGEVLVAVEAAAFSDVPSRTMPHWEKEEKPSLFVGRENELANLTSALAKAGEGHARPLFIVGGAGHGKTALINAFARRALAADDDLLVLSGYCRGPATAGEPYLPFRHILAQLTGDVTGSAMLCLDQAQRLWSAISHTIPLLIQHGPDLVDVLLSGSELRDRAVTFGTPQAPWFRRLDRLLARTDDNQPRKDGLFSQITAVLQAVAKERPLLLIVEDLHWTDAASANLLFHLCFELDQDRILLLGTYRPEEVDTSEGHPLSKINSELKRQFGDIWIDLAEEDGGDGRQFIAAYLDSEPNNLDERFRQKLFAHTAGHPLFTVELLRAMQQRGELVQDHAGLWQANESLDWQDLPAKIEGVIEQQFSRLDAELQDALTVACVEGETFTAGIVAEIQGLHERELVRRLSREVEEQHRLVQAEDLAWSNGRRLARYRFRHQLFQQYLYQQLDELECAYLHEAVALKLEQQHAGHDPPAAALAWHFDRAGNNEKAIPYLLQAGDEARLLYANEQAAAHYERALALLKAQGDYDQAARVLMKLGLTHMKAFDFEAAHAAYDEGFALQRQVAKRLAQSDPPPSPHTLHLAAYISPLEDLITRAWDDLLLLPRLFQITVDFDVLPDLARSWDILNGGCTYLFHLREDVFWSDGQPVTAGDFVFAWQRALNPQHGYPQAEMLYDIIGAADFRQGRNKDVQSLGFEALDDRTLKVELAYPTAYFLQVLTHRVAAPLPQHSFAASAAGGIETKNMVVCGPFLPEHRDKESIILARNPAYHGRYPGNVQRIEIQYCPSPTNQLALYEEGCIDVVDIRNVPRWDFEQAIRNHPDEYITGPALHTYGLKLNVNVPPFDDPRIRRAFVLATDRVRLTEVCEGARAFPATGGFVPRGISGHVPGIGLPFNPQKARRLLEEAGYPGGNNFPVLEAIITPWDVPRLPDHVFQPWQEILGVKISWQEVPWSSYLQHIQREQPHINIGSWSADYPDPDNFLRIALHVISDWRHETYDALLEQARRAPDHNLRLQLFRQAEEILVQEAPVLPLFGRNYHLLAKPWIKNIQPAMLYWPVWHHVIIEPH